MNQVLHFKLQASGIVAVVPYIGFMITFLCGSFVADFLRGNDLSNTSNPFSSWIEHNHCQKDIRSGSICNLCCLASCGRSTEGPPEIFHSDFLAGCCTLCRLPHCGSSGFGTWWIWLRSEPFGYWSRICRHPHGILQHR